MLSKSLISSCSKQMSSAILDPAIVVETERMLNVGLTCVGHCSSEGSMIRLH